MTRLTLLELVSVLEIPDVPEMDAAQFSMAAEMPVERDELFCALLRSQGLVACQEKILRWVKDLYGGRGS